MDFNDYPDLFRDYKSLAFISTLARLDSYYYNCYSIHITVICVCYVDFNK